MERLRAFESDDLDSLYEISLATGNAGRDASELYRDGQLLGHLYSAPYALLMPELAFVAEDEAGVAGYIVGTADTRAFEALLERDWWPTLRQRYPDPSGKPPESLSLDERRALMIHHPTPAPQVVVQAFPAHLHMNLAIRAQGHGLGAALLAHWLAAGRAFGVEAVHIGVNPGNTRAFGFWARCGFATLDIGSHRTIWMGLTIDAS